MPKTRNDLPEDARMAVIATTDLFTAVFGSIGEDLWFGRAHLP